MPQVECKGPDCPLCRAGSPRKRSMTLYDKQTQQPIGTVSLSEADIQRLQDTSLPPADWVLRRDNAGFFLEKA